MHKQAWDWLAKQAGTLPKTGKALDVGGRNINGNPRELFPGYEWTVVDPVAGPGVDVVGDFLSAEVHEQLDLMENGIIGFDLVVCTEVLEHLGRMADQFGMFRDMCRRTRVGGSLLVTAACYPRVPHNCNGSRPCNEPYKNVEDIIFDLDTNFCRGKWSLDHDYLHGDVYYRLLREF